MFIKDGFTYLIDEISRDEWMQYLIRFSDANISQTWEFGEIRWGNEKMNRIVIKKYGQIIGMAQARILNIPLIGGGVSYIHKGPVWKPLNELPDKNDYRIILRILKKIYVDDRNKILSIVPNEMEYGNKDLELILEEEGFKQMKSYKKEQTIFLDLKNLDEIRAGMRRKWRQYLGYAENMGLDLVLGTGDDLFNISLSLYDEMHRRKGFRKISDMKLYQKVHELLPPERKFKILICKYKGEPIGAMVWAEFGDTGYPLLAATGDKGIIYKCSYIIWWKMIKTMKENCMRRCDMGGIDPEENPGGYQFKTGISGKTGLNTTLFRQFDVMTGMKNRMIAKAVNTFRKYRTSIRSFLGTRRSTEARSGISP